MDFTPILSQVLNALWFLIPLAIFFSLIKTPWFKGKVGELVIRILFAIRLPKDEYRMLHNITLRTEDGGTTQIDHIIISTYGIFVIETKNMRGWIFGGEKQKMWTQKIFKRSFQFQNPLHQNYKHTKTIEKLLNIDPSVIFSVVVFVGDVKLKSQMPGNVTLPKGCIDFIQSKKAEIIDPVEAIGLYYEIESGALEKSLATDREHVDHVKQLVEKKKSAVKVRCPKCDSPMVLRTVKKRGNKGNKFWGCSAFPKCRSMLAIEDNGG